MELFSAEFFTALLSIIIIDLVLAGDNAIVIGLAARNVPKHQQKKVIIWGTAGAILIRILATLIVVWLLKIPGLLVVGGVLLVIIAYRLLTDDNDGEGVKSANNFWGAVRTIIIADALMGLDNVLAIAGAAQGHFLLVVIGLLISVPVIVFGSTLILKWIDRFPIIITIGAAVLSWTAAKMIVDEPLLTMLFDNEFLKYGFQIIVVVGVILIARLRKEKLAKRAVQQS